MILVLAAAGGFWLGMAVAAMLVISKEQDDDAARVPISDRFFATTPQSR